MNMNTATSSRPTTITDVANGGANGGATVTETSSVASSTTKSPTKSSSGALVKVGLLAGLAASAATSAVAASARAVDVPLTIDGEQIPVVGFGQLTFFAAVIGTVLAIALGKRANRPGRTFQRTTLALTCLSIVPDLMIGASTATKITLVVTHLVAAAIVIPALTSRLAGA